jgi:predicted deacylase
MNHYLVSPRFTLHDWGFQYGPEDAPASLAVVMDQHGDEYTGRRAGAAMARVLAAWGAGRPAHGPFGSWPVPPGFDRFRVTVVTTLNPEGFAMGTRKNGEGKDLNRCWNASADHVEIARVWDALQELPGRRYLVDVHGTWVNRDEDPEPDSHLYVVPESEPAALFSGAFADSGQHGSSRGQEGRDPGRCGTR